MTENRPGTSGVPAGSEPVAAVAMTVAAAMIANHVGGRATRDALFFSNFEVTALPGMLVAASVFTVAVAGLTSRAMTQTGPRGFIRGAFAASGLLLLAEWGASSAFPRPTAVAVYLHLAVVGAFLISGFWSVVNEQFDPRTAKRHIGQIAGGATLGGLGGGILAERVAATTGVMAMFPLLAAMHLFCAWRLGRLGKGPGLAAGVDPEREGPLSSLKGIGRAPYLRDLALLVLLGALASTFLDYVFKARAVAALEGSEDLLRFFAVFYTGVGLLTFLVQTSLSRVTLERLGLAKTVATLPGGVAAGALGVLIFPGLVSAAVARATESVLRSSLFRSGYELLYTPIAPARKRAAKPIIDVGVDRLGDAVGGALVASLLLLGPEPAQRGMLLAGLILAGLALWVAHHLHQGYVKELERSLLDHALELDISQVEDLTTRQTVMQTLASLDLTSLPELSGTHPIRGPRADETTPVEEGPEGRDPTVRQFRELRSGDPERVRHALNMETGLDPLLVGQGIQLLAWDEVYPDVIRSLSARGPAIAGQLIDSLLDPDQDFGIRRRIPRVLAGFDSPRTVEGLLMGLDDARFEVRYQCGRALATIRKNSREIRFPPERVHELVLKEIRVDRRVWESHRLLDPAEPDEREEPPVDEYLRRRASRGLEHVFALLSLTLPQEPLRVAFRGLHTDDRALKGTALEYLESILPPRVRDGLWPFLEDDRGAAGANESREKILAALMESNQSIELNLAKLSRKAD